MLDLHTGELVESLEGFGIELDGTVYTSSDVNFWGVTVAADDRTFYATLASGGRTWLVQGDLSTRSVRAVRAGPSAPRCRPTGGRWPTSGG